MVDAGIIEIAKIAQPEKRSADSPVAEAEIIVREAAIHHGNEPHHVKEKSPRNWEARINEALQLLPPSIDDKKKDAIRDVLGNINIQENLTELDPDTAKAIVKKLTEAGISLEDLQETINQAVLSEAREVLEQSQQKVSTESNEEVRSEHVTLLSEDDLNYNKPPTQEEMIKEQFEFLYNVVKTNPVHIMLFQLTRFLCIVQIKLGLFLEKDARNKKKSESGLSHEEIIQKIKENVSYIRVVNVLLSAVKNDTSIISTTPSTENESQKTQKSMPPSREISDTPSQT